jgi:hypothetical protein
VANKYWVGGTGNTSDTNHWSLTSGGTGGAGVPTSADNAIFDAASFTATGQTVTVNAILNCYSLDFSAATNNGTFTQGNYAINVYDSLTLNPNITFNFVSNSIYFCSTLSTSTILSCGKSLRDLNKVGTGTLKLLDNLTVSNALYTQYGTLDLNGQTLTTYSVQNVYTTTRSLIFNDGIIKCNSYTNGTVNTGLTLNMGTEGKIQINSTSASNFITDETTVFNKVEVLADKSISLASCLTKVRINELILNGNSTLTGKSGLVLYTNTLTNQNVNCVKGVTITGTGMSLSMPTQTVLMDYYSISGLTGTGGAVYDARNSVDGGSNVGINFMKLVSDGVVSLDNDNTRHYQYGSFDGSYFNSGLKVYNDIVSDFTGGRAYHQCVELNGIIYVIGGYNGSSYLNTVYAYDTINKTWSQRTNIQTARQDHKCVVLNGKIYIIGGYNGSYLNSIEEYDPSTNIWTNKTGMGYQRQHHQCLVYNGKIYAIGGYNGSYLNKVEEYDPVANTWTQKAVMNYLRIHHQCVLLDGKIYAIGGHNSTNLKTVEVFDPVANTWTIKTDMNSIRYNHQCIVYDNKIIAIGGFTGSTYLKSVEEYDPIANTWTYKANMNTARIRHYCLELNGNIYAIGGQGTGGALNSVEEYNPNLDTWTNKTSMNAYRIYHQCIVHNNKIYALGGYTGSAYLNSVEIVNKTVGAATASYTSRNYYLDSLKKVNTSKISWTETLPANTTVTIQTTLDDGLTWNTVTNGGSITGINTNDDLTGKVLKYKVEMGTADVSVTPIVNSIKIEITDSSDLPQGNKVYWVGGTGNTNDAAHWSFSSGGSGGVGVPSATSNIVINDSSFTGTNQTITVNAALSCYDFDASGVTSSQTLAGSSAVTINGNSLKLSTSLTKTYAGSITMSSPYSGNIIEVKGSISATIVISGIGYFDLLNDLILASITITKGTFNTNDQSITCAVIDSSNSNIRTLNTGTSTITVASYVNFQTQTNATFNMSNTNFIINSTGQISAFGTTNLNINNLIINQGKSPTIASGNTLSVNQLQLSKSSTLTMTGATITLRDTLIADGESGATKITITGGTFSKSSGNVDIYNCALTSNTGSGGAVYTAHKTSNGGGNVNWIFDGSIAKYWVGGTGNWTTSAMWSWTSGGAGGAGNPGVNEDAIFDAASFTTTGQIVTVNATANCYNLDWTNATNNPTFTHTSQMLIVYGSYLLCENMTLNRTGSSQIILGIASGSSSTIKSYGKDLGYIILQGQGTYTLLDNLYTTSSLEVQKGTFNTNDKNLECGSFITSTTSAKTINLGASIITTNSMLNFSAYTGLTLNPGTSKIIIKGTTRYNVKGGGKTYYDLEIQGTGEFDGAITLNRLIIKAGKNCMLDHLTTMTVNRIETDADIINKATLVSRTSPSQATILQANGTSVLDYVNVKDVLFKGGGVLNCRYSTDQGNNKNVVFLNTNSIKDIDDYKVEDFDYGVYTDTEFSGGVALKSSLLYSAKASMNVARTNHQCVELDGKIYAIGGHQLTSTYLNSVEMYDPVLNTWTVKANMNVARTNHKCVVLSGKIYAIGGENPSSVNSVEEYDPIANTWTVKAPMNTARVLHQCVVVNGNIYVIGSNNSSDKTIEKYDPNVDVWNYKASFSIGVYEFRVAVLNGKIYKFGGYNSGSGVSAVIEEYNIENDTWTNKTSMNVARYHHQCVVLNNKIYAIGGHNGTAYISSIEEYDPISNTWTNKVSMNSLRRYHQCVILNNKIYCIGGSNASATLNTVDEFDPIGNTCTAKTNLTTARYSHQSIAVNGKIYTIGGYGSTYLSSVECIEVTYVFDLSTKTNINTARYMHQCVAANGKVYTIGGSNASGVLNSTEEYDPILNTWTTKAPMNVARNYHRCVELNGKIYAIGGQTTAATAVVEEYDPVLNTWTAKASLNIARLKPECIVFNGKIYVIGGYGVNYLNSIEEYDPVANTWTTKVSLNVSRSDFGCCLLNDKIYITGGTGSSVFNSVEVFDPVANTCTLITSMATARQGHQCVVFNGKIYSIGGTNTVSPYYLNSIEEYNPETNLWTTKVAMAAYRSLHKSVALNGKIYSIGGTSTSGTHLNTIEEYDPINNTRVSKATMSTTKSYHQCATLNNKVYIVGGYNGTYLNATECMRFIKDGNYISKAFDLSKISKVGGSRISWSESVPANSTLTMYTSIDNQATWQQVNNGAPIPGVTLGSDLYGTSVTYKAVYTSSEDGAVPSVSNVIVQIDEQADSIQSYYFIM